MNKITFPLKLQMKGPKVADLHVALQTLGYVIADAEKSTSRFGATTRQALLDFQSKHGLAPSGEVDEPTAARLNLALASLGVIDDENKWRVHGRISYRDGQPAAHMQVRVYDRDVTRETLLGETTTDDDGHYTLTYAESQFRHTPAERGGPELFLRVFGQDSLLLGQSKMLRNAPADATLDAQVSTGMFRVFGRVAKQDGSAGAGLKVVAVDRDLRKEETLGTAVTDAQGRYEILYSREQFARAEKDRADLVVKAFAADGSLVVASPIVFNAAPVAEIDLTIPAEIQRPLTLFEKIGRELNPLLDGVRMEELEEDKEHQDLSFLFGETGFEKSVLARFAVAHRLAQHCIQAEFWFALLGGSFFQFVENQSLKEQVAVLLDSLSSLDAAAVRKALTRAFNQKELPEAFRENIDGWVEAFLKFIASHAVSGAAKPTFVKLALEHASIEGAEKQEKFARLFNEHKAFTPELLDVMQKDPSFNNEEIADLRTSFQLSELTRGDFSIVKMLKDESGIRRPEQIRTLARKSESEWVSLVKERHAAGDITLPIEVNSIAGQETLPPAEVYGKMLERQFREAFPTTAFAGGLERALSNGGARGLRKAETLSRFLERHENFELLNTPVDDFLKNSIRSDSEALATDEDFRLEVKAVQRVFKLAPTFAATDALLADDLHSAQQVYRVGESEFVRRYSKRPGFTAETARSAWNRSADTYAAVLTIVADLKALQNGSRFGALQTATAALSTFPNWNNLFKAGDLCECEHCRSVLSPAAYFADLLVFLKDRKAANPARTVKDILFGRRPDLGYLELNCANALTPFPYIDTVCEVLEHVVAAGENDVELPGFAAMPAGAAAAKAAVAAAFAAKGISLGIDFSLSQVAPANPNLWVAHGDDVTYLLKKNPPADFFAEVLRNTKASAAELRAYPQFVNPEAYKKLAEAKYPLGLPFDLFGEEVRAAFQKTKLQRWDLMRTLRSTTAPKNPSDGDIAAEYFGISSDPFLPAPVNPADATDEKHIILTAKPTTAWQQVFWDEPAIPGDLNIVKIFLQKTGLEYNEMLSLIDLKFINPDGDIIIQHLDASCDTDKKVIQALDATKLDRIHRFLRLWRKLKGWKMWELDLVVRHPRIGAILNPNGSLDEPFLLNLFYFSQLKERLGGKTTVEQVCSLFGDLNMATRFTKLHEKREDALYQNLFLNKRLTNPLDPAFQLDPGTGDLPAGDTITGHHAMVLAALGIREADLVVLKELTKASDGALYINDVLTLSNLSFLWRHAWLFKLLKFKAEEWKTLLKIFQQDISHFATSEAAWKFVERIDYLKAAGFTADELNWLLAADRSANAATKEADAARFLVGLRKDLQAIQAEYDPTAPRYAFLSPPRDEDNLSTLLISLWQRLARDETEASVFLMTLRGHVLLEADVQGLGVGFAFPAAITGAPINIPIRYERVLRFSGLMTTAQRTTLLTDASLTAAVTGLLSYQQAIEALFQQSEQATVTGLPAGFTFPAAITRAPNNIPVRYESVLRFTGVMTDTQRTVLLSNALPAAVTGNLAYANAIADIFQQSLTAVDNYVSVEVEVALPGGVVLPAGKPSLPIRYNPTTQKLAFTGLMTEAERLALNAAGNPPSAVDELFQLPRLAVKFFEPVFTAPLDTLPPAVDFRAQLATDLAMKISYDGEQRLLRFAGIMTNSEESALDALVANVLPSEVAYHTAISSLKDQPQNIALPDDRIWLTDTDLDITQLANDSLAKRLANAAKKGIDYLSKTLAANAVVQQTSAQLGLAEALTRRLLDGFAVMAPIAPGPQKTTLLAHLTRTFAVTTSVVDYTVPTAKPTFDGWFWANRVAAILKKWKITLTELEKITALTAGAQLLDFGTLPLDNSNPAAIGPIDRFLRTNRLLRFRDSLPETNTSFFEVLQKLNSGVYAAPAAVDAQGLPIGFTVPASITGGLTPIPIQYDEPNKVLRFTGQMSISQRSTLLTDPSLAAVTGIVRYRQGIEALFRSNFAGDVERLNEGWPATDVVALTASLDLAYPADFLLVENWERMRRAFYFLDNLNAGLDTVTEFAAAAMSDVHAKKIKELLRSKFGTETWLALATEIQDILRERKRDALAAYLLTQPRPADAPSGKWENTNDLYAYYLLDVEMSSCQLTSRLVQGSGSIQLFVQRCFMGLEPGVAVEADGPTGDSAWRWWTWMRKYRVWEANRKVFLWPENWIEPELKKDKSPFFKDMENELLQNEMNQYTAETAFSNYLEKLDGVAQLEIAGFYQEDDGDNTFVHVFGRTAGTEPHLYYYRRYDYRQWTPWEKVELDIQGDYLIPAVVNQRLFLFWPVFTEVPDETENSEVRIPRASADKFAPDKTMKKLRLQMAVSDYRQGRWTPKKVSTDFDESPSYGDLIVRKHYRFFAIDKSQMGGSFYIKYDGFSQEVSETLVQKARDQLAVAEGARGAAATVQGTALGAREAAQMQLNSKTIPNETAVTRAQTARNTSRTLRDEAVAARDAYRATVETAKADLASYLKKFPPPVPIPAPSAAEVAKSVSDFAAILKSPFDLIAKDIAVNNLQAGLDRAQALLEDAESAFDKARTSYDKAETKRDNAQNKLDAAQTNLDVALADVTYAQLKLGSYQRPLAALAGAFEVSGCRGVPELTKFSGSFMHAIRPERESSGNDTLFLKWAEVGPQPPRQDAPQNDFTLENSFATQSGQQLLTPVLQQTPWLFKMTPPWQLSYLDNLWLDGLNGLMALSKRFDKPPLTPTGSWLPFFYNDKKRTFFVLPALGGTRKGGADNDDSVSGGSVGAGAVKYYPDIKRVFRQLEDAVEGQVQTMVNGFALSALTAPQRQQLEMVLHEQFSEVTETLPPYTDQQVKNLLKRFFMQFFHWYLGTLALKRFQSRKFHFKNFYHTFVCDFAKLVRNPLKGIPALMARETQLKNTGFSFRQSYVPQSSVLEPGSEDFYPKEFVDFTPDGAYSPYNWELFFHAPLLIANSLSKNQRFEDARDWYHFIFNPVGVESPAPGGSQVSKYWITKPFFETTDPQYIQQRIDNIMSMLAQNKSGPGQPLTELENQVLDWRTNPFEPHRIANYRTVAYQKMVVMKYLDNLIAWGDNLFRQDSMESTNEATQLYVLAAEILGPRPKRIPPQVKPPVESFNELESEFDKFSNALIEVENVVPLLPGNGPSGTNQAPLPMLYFCIPQNDKMLGYWDTVADRLYKLRHCMNIEGVVRQLALFEPPIDPGALVKAVAGGVDISSALADLNAPLPLYRFNVLLQKANEVCNDVKALGGALLAALEKKDGEAMGLLRQSQEIRLLEVVKTVREKQIEEAMENLEGVKKSKVVIETRRNYYRDIEKLITQERLHLAKLNESHTLQEAAQGVKLAASIISFLPHIDLGVSGFGGSPKAGLTIGGLELGQAAGLAGDVLSFLSQIASNDASMASSKGGFDRRWDDWKLQARLAEKELDQIDKQLASGELRIAIAEKELDNHIIQIENAKATDAFMRSKYTNEELYQWQVGQISGVYFQSYKLAYDLAKRAERCFRFELGLQDTSYINFGYWDSLKKGLLSGEKLQYDLRRLETAYLEQNRREFELTKHVSLALLDPLALVKLRETGRCFLRLPEEIFDLDYPGHYFRRIKSVSLTLPCVVGPYATISCTLRLLKNSVRINTANVDNGYPRNIDDRGLPADDSRFIENNIPVKAIAASNAQNDSGVFELSFRDERYLPFEGAGAVSEWSLELFSDLPSNNPDPGRPDFGKPLRQFDYGTISDAILHVKYTAREDAGPFKNAAITHLRDYFHEDGATPSLRMFNLRQEFPTQWHRFLNPTNPADGNVFELEMSSSLFPLRDAAKTLKVNTIWLLARCTDAGTYEVVMTPPLPAPPPAGSNTMTLALVNQYGGLHFSQKGDDDAPLGIEVVPVKWQIKITRPSPGGENLQVAEIEDVLLVVGYEWD